MYDVIECNEYQHDMKHQSYDSTAALHATTIMVKRMLLIQSQIS